MKQIVVNNLVTDYYISQDASVIVKKVSDGSKAKSPILAILITIFPLMELKNAYMHIVQWQRLLFLILTINLKLIIRMVIN